MIDNLSSRQLRANAEIRVANNERIGMIDHDCVEQENEVSSQNIRRDTHSNLEKWIEELEILKKLSPRWEKGADLQCEKNLFPESDYSQFKNLSIIDVFERFIDVEIIDHIVQETQRYALFLNYPDPKISADEIRCFIAILFVSGYNDLPSKRHYWDSNDDMRNYSIYNAMRRDRFLQICRFCILRIIAK